MLCLHWHLEKPTFRNYRTFWPCYFGRLWSQLWRRIYRGQPPPSPRTLLWSSTGRRPGKRLEHPRVMFFYHYSVGGTRRQPLPRRTWTSRQTNSQVWWDISGGLFWNICLFRTRPRSGSYFCGITWGKTKTVEHFSSISRISKLCKSSLLLTSLNSSKNSKNQYIIRDIYYMFSPILD